MSRRDLGYHTWIAIAACLASIASVQAAELFIGGSKGEAWKGDSKTGGFTYFTCTCTGPITSMTVNDTHLIYGDTFGIAVKAGLATGAIEQFYFTGAANSAVVLDGGDMLFGSTNKTVTRVDPTTGAIKKTLATPFDVQAMALVGDDLFLGSETTLIHKGNKDTGGFVAVGACGGVINSMVQRAGVLYIGDKTGRVYKKVGAAPAVYYFQVDNDATALAFDGDELLIGGTSGLIVRANPDTGQILGTMMAPISIDAMAVRGGDCPADLDGDGHIGQSDLGLLLGAYGTNDAADLDGDGDTDQSDLGHLLAKFGQSCP
jgi:hypothetical protein